MLPLSGYSRHLETDTKMLSLSLECLTHFIKTCPLGEHSVNQFPTIFGVGSHVWNLLQMISEARWDCFKVSPQPDTSTLMEAIKIIYSPDLVPTPFPEVKMAVDALEAKEVTFTLVTNKKCKRKSKASFLPSMSSSNFRSKTSLILHAILFFKAIITCLASKLVTTYPSLAVTP